VTRVCGAIGALVALAMSDQEPQRPAFRATADVVRVDVSVRQGSRVVDGLTAKDFEVLDNGVPQQVSELSYGRLPIDVTVGLDVSFSVTGPLLQQLQRAVSQLMRDLRDGDRLKLMLFNMRVMRVIDFTTDEREVERAIRAVQAGGGTALFDAISAAFVSAPSSERRQLLMFFTDGMDSSSSTSPEALREVAQRTNATLAFLVSSAGARGPAPTAPAVSFLVQLAQETGGAAIFTARTVDLSTPFRSILERFRSTYVLHYTPRGVDQPGFHTLEVRVKRDKAIVTARRGYFR
jgi:VWFA-related protein